jgi:hypothetical protein
MDDAETLGVRSGHIGTFGDLLAQANASLAAVPDASRIGIRGLETHFMIPIRSARRVGV